MSISMVVRCFMHTYYELGLYILACDTALPPHRCEGDSIYFIIGTQLIVDGSFQSLSD